MLPLALTTPLPNADTPLSSLLKPAMLLHLRTRTIQGIENIEHH